MSTFANQLKSEIARIAKKENKSENAALKKASAQYRSEIAALKRRLVALESMVAKLGKHAVKAGAEVVTADDDEKSLRFRVAGFASLRKKLGVSANEMGALLGVSGQSVYKWEQGKAKPRASQMQAIAAVRKLGKKQVAELLAAE
jgi:DNA-binding transcriptional regulator YiaG